MLFQKLSIVVTDRCNAECEFCCFSCSPRGKQVLTEGQIRRVIREAKDTEGMEEICFTGGEPLLFMDLVESCAAYAKELGLKSSVYTNGFWGADARRAAEWAGRLKDAGVYRMHFSADPWHQQYVPFAALRTAMRCSREAGLANELSVMEVRGSDHRRRVLEEMPEEANAAMLIVYPLLPVGRAKEHFTDEQILKPFPADAARCFYDKMALLMADGTYSMCCKIHCRSIPKIMLGHMDTVSVSDLGQIVLSDDYLYLMLKEGFSWYIRRMREMGYDVPERVCFPCACCEIVFNHTEFMARIREEVRARAEMLRQEDGNGF